ncbi:MAG: cell wall hydrolase [Sphingomonas bacterium]|uniref:cell wall hydrolase n=1 Tax=Sphingomonas bacterium TaxID=1895847 RepID=UPI00261AB4BC|nr:cell wall hydrolase [Sphingomonas bacterium]MDB5695542.1 cell wall hydrolase [Sphingomonas bacterium]
MAERIAWTPNQVQGDGGGRWLRPILLLVAALALLVPALLVRYAPPVPIAPRFRPAALPPQRVVPAAELPKVEPLALIALTTDAARAYNAEVPYVTGPNPAARPYRFVGSDIDRARAVDCLAAALIYEAGDSVDDQRPVAQVILNRLRHPAFPKTVCGVVFEGSERRTGCQFTFTCDGALARWSPSPAGWLRAQAMAAAALNGAVSKQVGWATHYHTDWVVPYWQSSLDKLAKVGTHLFFRWTGWWGTPGAFRNPGAQAEPALAKMAALSPVHRASAGLPDEMLAGVVAEALDEEMEAAPAAAGEPDSFLVTLRPTTAPALYPSLAETACGARTRCSYHAWLDPRETPTALPLRSEQIATMTFAYLRDRTGGVERTLWNCQQVPRADKRQCMKVQVLAPAPEPTPVPVVAPKGPTELDGVRRRPATPAPAASPTPVRPPGTSPAAAPSPTPPRPRSAS